MYGFSKIAEKPVNLEKAKDLAMFSSGVALCCYSAASVPELGSWTHTSPQRAWARIEFDLLFTDYHADLSRL
jgi:hypothetical protein